MKFMSWMVGKWMNAVNLYYFEDRPNIAFRFIARLGLATFSGQHPRSQQDRDHSFTCVCHCCGHSNSLRNKLPKRKYLFTIARKKPSSDDSHSWPKSDWPGFFLQPHISMYIRAQCECETETIDSNMGVTALDIQIHFVINPLKGNIYSSAAGKRPSSNYQIYTHL